MEYCMVGCVEPNIHGKMSQWSDGGHYNFGAAVQLALDNGPSWVDGRQLGAATGPTASIESFDALKAAVKAQLRHFIEHIAIANMIVQVGHSLYLPKPFSSALVEGCVESGTDMADGGAKYNAGPAFIGTGIADLADSLAAVKQLVFEDEELTLPQLVDVLRDDFEGHEDIRQMLITRAPKYGNDIDEVDGLAREFTDYVADVIDGYTSFTGCKIINGLYPVSSTSRTGRSSALCPRVVTPGSPSRTAARPSTVTTRSGRRPWSSPWPRSTTLVTPPAPFSTSSCNPDLLKEDRDLDNLAALIRSFFTLGGYHIQFNVVTGDTLRAAQSAPDQYRGLLVRVAGYSAYFTDLCREMQDDIIDRTEHCAWGA